MSLIARQIRTPKPFDPERGEDVWTRLPDPPPAAKPLITGAAGCSPYLADLLLREADWINPALAQPEEATADLFAGARRLEGREVSAGLRAAKRRLALLLALGDLAGVWPLEHITGALTEFADIAVERALRAALRIEIERGRLPGKQMTDLEVACGVVVLAMGKMGAGELNYSSDIDLICLFDETQYAAGDYPEARASIIRAIRRMVATLSDKSAEGYVFRTDLRLRPDPSATPVCLSMASAEAYYESEGRAWERAAYIKARPCAGDLRAGEQFLERLRPFVWRRHLDFAAIEDTHEMRLKIRDHKGFGGPLILEGHNIKLGRGGIREIEFFAQTNQLICGGRDDSLRERETLAALRALAKAGRIPVQTAETLANHYRFHRETEHRLQMLRDAQTHELPATDEGFTQLADFMDMTVDDLRAQLRNRSEEVHKTTEDFFAPGEVEQTSVPDYATDTVEQWPGYAAMRSSRASEIFDRLKTDIFERLDRAANPKEALLRFDGFLRGLPAGVQLFSLFEANPKLTGLIIDICATSPALAAYLSANSRVLDAVIDGDFFAQWPETTGLRTLLRETLTGASDYEEMLNLIRIWAHEWHFRIGVHLLRDLIDPNEAGQQYAELAEVCLAELSQRVAANFALRHGRAPGRGFCVVAMGSLGAGRLHARSDLDLLVIYDAAGQESSDGDRPLGTRVYYARLTQALITALTAHLPSGPLYEVDMRLRPSGKGGPVATSLQSFRRYQMEDAWVWEHLALSRARTVAGPEELCREVDRVRADVITAPADRAKIAQDYAEMRARLRAVRQPGPWDAKIGPGRLQDIELAAQTLALQQGCLARDVAGQIAGCSDLPGEAKDGLIDAGETFWQVQSLQRLITEAEFDPQKAGEGATQRLLKALGCDTVEEALQLLQAKASKAVEIINEYIVAEVQDADRSDQG